MASLQWSKKSKVWSCKENLKRFLEEAQLLGFIELQLYFVPCLGLYQGIYIGGNFLFPIEWLFLKKKITLISFFEDYFNLRLCEFSENTILNYIERLNYIEDQQWISLLKRQIFFPKHVINTSYKTGAVQSSGLHSFCCFKMSNDWGGELYRHLLVSWIHTKHLDTCMENHVACA